MHGLLTRSGSSKKNNKFKTALGKAWFENFFNFDTVEIPSSHCQNFIFRSKENKKSKLTDKLGDSIEKKSSKKWIAEKATMNKNLFNNSQSKTEMHDNSSEEEEEEEESMFVGKESTEYKEKNKTSWMKAYDDQIEDGDSSVSAVSDEEEYYDIQEQKEQEEIEFEEELYTKYGKWMDRGESMVRKRPSKMNKKIRKVKRRPPKGNQTHKLERKELHQMENIEAKKKNIERRIGFMRRGPPINIHQYEENEILGSRYGRRQVVNFMDEYYENEEEEIMMAIQQSIMVNLENQNENLRHSNKMTEIGLTESQIYTLQTRELTEDDYAILCQLDEHVEKPSVERDVLENLEKKMIQQLEDTEIDTCMICFNDVEVGDTLITLPRCSHEFHKGCLEKWLGEHSRSCPLCQVKVCEEYD